VTQQQPWSGFKYEPVRGLRDRLISRYLRGQRKNMRRFFTERGLLEFTDRMDRIRKSRQGMMAKNALFQKVLDDYAKQVTDANGGGERSNGGAAPSTGIEAAPVEGGAGGVAVSDPGTDSNSSSIEPTPSVPEVAITGGDGVVIEE
jgi:hypothetical protein